MPHTRLILVTGSGRSGTSTVAGTLKRLGLFVPQPEMPANDTNPRGFYEPQWVVELHKGLLDSLPARTNDARPQTAAEAAEVAADPAVVERLRSWLSEQVALAGEGGQLVVKDPRIFWFDRLWTTVADELGLELSYLTMIRHPAEVVQSRETHYLSDKSDDLRGTRQTANLAGWVNNAYESEVVSRGRPRAFVRYTDLLADWRAAMALAQSQLGIDVNTDLGARQAHEVDDFIDVKLYRNKVSWDGVDTLPALQDLAAEAWEACNALVEAPQDSAAMTSLDDVHERYARLHRYAEAITFDQTTYAVAQARRKVQERNAALRARLERRRREVRELERRLSAMESPRRFLPWKR